MMRSCLIIAAIAATSCTGPAASSPTPVPSISPSSPSPAPKPGVSVAALAVSSFEVNFRVLTNGYSWVYHPRMVLTETTGKSAAWLQSISFSLPDGSTILVGPGCLLTNQVPSNQSWNLERVYVYCLDLDSNVDISGREVEVTVSFLDEEGRSGTVKGTATVSN